MYEVWSYNHDGWEKEYSCYTEDEAIREARASMRNCTVNKWWIQAEIRYQGKRLMTLHK